ncbi:MAG: Microsomal dipeptidase [uncultured Thermomicrobiales bacterium]|uniref:Microsomal dipeptidase n=1 Tax=uncultured Thermomicrobiales bacterium TaxID=1645740 RepID=A0A6J4UDQ9_9BACT|nr:MAG: Microsomal dipeptidase [uncultured Thermomicrobiales bacterium]
MTVAPPKVVPIVDGHTDVLLDLLHPNRNPGRDFFARGAAGHVDLPRLREGGIGAALLACFVPDDDVANGRALIETLRMVDLFRRLVAEGDGRVTHVFDPAGLRACLDDGVFGAILHYEGADALDPDLAVLRLSYDLGLRSLGLVWSRPNAFAQGVGPQDTGQGLTGAGRDLVRACNEMGVLLDVSHLNDAGFWDVVETTTRPIVASHSNSKAISPHPRNLSDDQIRAIAENGGLLGLNFAIGFLWPDMGQRTDLPLDLMVDHVAHVADLVGIEHVAIGSDYDGARVPDAVADASQIGRLVEHLRLRDFTEPDIAAICHGNWLRVFDAVWR